ncbi:hypothetical protein [Streptomyces sp. NPDC020965]|uniref:hypothetical protein n=1 Tax=Streptomyces sp. NPDC020965 TaxID=3365105 RepID=UPI0037AEDA12
MKRLRRAVASAAVVTATVVGAIAGTAGTAQAYPSEMTYNHCNKPGITALEFEPYMWPGALYLCGGGFGDKIARYLFADGSQQVFFVGADYAIWSGWFTPGEGWGPMVSLGGKVTSDPVISAYSGNALTLKVRGTDGRSWYKDRYANGAWSAWHR